jgi:enoyl reductase-like protein
MVARARLDEESKAPPRLVPGNPLGKRKPVTVSSELTGIAPILYAGMYYEMYYSSEEQ